MQPTTQTIVRHTVIFCTTQRKDAQDREPTRRQKPSHLVGTPNGWTLSSVGPAKKFCFDNGKGRGKKIPCYLNWNTHPVLPASFVIWIHNPSIVQENLRHELKQIWGGQCPPVTGGRKCQLPQEDTTSGRPQLSFTQQLILRYIPNLKMLKCGRYIIWNQWNMVADK